MVKNYKPLSSEASAAQHGKSGGASDSELFKKYLYFSKIFLKNAGI